MILNLLGWGYYFLASCFMGTSNAMTEEDGCCDTMNHVINDGQCCVFDSEYKNDRCCSLSRSFKSSPAFFCFGHVTDSEDMTAQRYAAAQLIKKYKVLLFIFACIFSIIGVVCVVSPETVVFNVVITDEFREQLGIQEAKSAPLDEQIHKDTVMSMLKNSMNGLSSLFDSSDEISREEVARIRDMLSSVQNNLVYSKPEAVSITEPTAILGGTFLFYAMMCVYQLTMSDSQLLDLRNVYLHGIWYGCCLVAIISASAGHGRNLENSKFVIALIVFYITGAVAFVILERMMHGYMHKFPPARYSISSSDDDRFNDDDDDDDDNREHVSKKKKRGQEN